MSPDAGSKSQRLFFALWPDPASRQRIAAVQTADRIREGRPIATANLHLTLAFLGNIRAEQIASIQQAAAQVVFEPFSLTLDRLGWWRRAGILWLGPSAWPAQLDALVRDLWLGMEAVGLRPQRRPRRRTERHPFKPHVTLARKCSQARPATTGRLAEPIGWPITGFVLVESRLDPDGASYRVLARWGTGTSLSDG
ncbi:MAG: RNA 2',3'-cyclic phosphodiesterase [Gammaproteobacteria bacterium]